MNHPCDPQPARRAPAAPRRRRAVALYAVCLFLSIIIVSAGVGLINMQRAQRRTLSGQADTEQAYVIAQGGIEWALLQADLTPDWRKLAASGVPVALAPPFGGSIEVTFTDDDGDITDDLDDAVTITSKGTFKTATRSLSAVARPGPHPGLEYALWGNVAVTFKGRNIAMKGPVYSPGTITLEAAANGFTATSNASFNVPDTGAIVGALAPQNAEAAPVDKPLIDYTAYLAEATAVSLSSGKLTKAVLSPDTNTTGATNAKGIYYINAGSSSVTIDSVRLRGTLIIRTTGNVKIEFKSACAFEPVSIDRPVLIIDAPSAEIRVEFSSTSLSELLCLVDFNEDRDLLDTVPARISGVVWTNAPNSTFKSTVSVPFKGCWIGETITLESTIVIDDDPAILSSPPDGLVDGKAHLVTHSVREELP